MLRDAGDAGLAARPRSCRRRPTGRPLRRLAGCGERVVPPGGATSRPATAGASWRRARTLRPRRSRRRPGRRRPRGRAGARAPRAAAHRRTPTRSPTTRSCARLADAGIRPARIVFPWEGHAWETAMIDGRARAPAGHRGRSRYDNLNFSRFALSLYPGAAELGVRPLPDRVVTNGETFARSPRGRRASRGERIRVGCALRHASLLRRRRAGTRPRGERVRARGREHRRGADHRDAPGRARGVRRRPAGEAAPGVRHRRGSGPLRPRASATTTRPHHRAAHARARDGLHVQHRPVRGARRRRAADLLPVRRRSSTSTSSSRPLDVRWAASDPEELRAALVEAEAAVQAPAWGDDASSAVAEAFSPVAPDCVAAFLDDLPTGSARG